MKTQALGTSSRGLYYLDCSGPSHLDVHFLTVKLSMRFVDFIPTSHSPGTLLIELASGFTCQNLVGMEHEEAFELMRPYQFKLHLEAYPRRHHQASI